MEDWGYTHLGFDVEKTATTALGDLVDGHERGAVEVAGEFGVFDECILFDEVLEFFAGYKVVVFAVLFTWTWGAGCVCVLLMGCDWGRQKYKGQDVMGMGMWVRHDETENG